MKKIRLFTPGPTPLFPSAQNALSQNAIHHRTPEFKKILENVRKKLQKVFKTEQDVVLLTSSGSGAMEASAGSLLSPGDRVLVVSLGKFGERWEAICQGMGAEVQTLTKPYGETVQASELSAWLSASPKALFLQGCETSTATGIDLKAVADRVQQESPDTLIVVDAITALGSQPVETDAWGLDIVISGSQKSFGLPPGLSFLAISERALETMQSNPNRPYYFDLVREVESQRKGKTAFTPTTALTVALSRALDEILELGVDTFIEETQQMAHVSRIGFQAIGFKLVSQAPANAVTAVFPPEPIQAPELARRLDERFGLKVAGGQGPLSGQIIRIAHLGYFDILDVFTVLSAVELCLAEMGVAVEPGSGVGAALKELSAL